MIQPDNENLKQKVQKISDFSLIILRSLSLWRWVGYGFLILFFVDLVEIIVPSNFLNPEWEFRVMGAVIERVAVPLIAVLLIFYGGNYLRSRWETSILKILSWLTLVGGIVLILLIPLGIVNTVRIYQQNNAQINQQVNQNLTVLQQIETRLDTVKTKEEMQQLLSLLSSRGNAPEIENFEQLEQVKGKLSEFISNSRRQVTTRAKMTYKQRRIALFKSSGKWNLGALISGVLFINAWRFTKWARSVESAKTKK